MIGPWFLIIGGALILAALFVSMAVGWWELAAAIAEIRGDVAHLRDRADLADERRLLDDRYDRAEVRR